MMGFPRMFIGSEGGSEVGRVVGQLMEEYLKTPEVQERLKAIVKDEVDKAIPKVVEDTVKERVESHIRNLTYGNFFRDNTGTEEIVKKYLAANTEKIEQIVFAAAEKVLHSESVIFESVRNHLATIFRGIAEKAVAQAAAKKARQDAKKKSV